MRPHRSRWRASIIVLGLTYWLILGWLTAVEVRAEPPWISASTGTANQQPVPDNDELDAATPTDDAAAENPQPQLAPRQKSAEAPRSAHALPPQGSSEGGNGLSAGKSLTTVFGGLAVVVGLFLAAAWLFRKSAPAGNAALPPEAFEVLGRGRLSGKQTVSLVRCGGKLLLVSQAADGPRTLTEIHQPEEVTRLAGLCKQTAPKNSAASFRDVFQQLGGVRRESAAERGRHGA